MRLVRAIGVDHGAFGDCFYRIHPTTKVIDALRWTQCLHLAVAINKIVFVSIVLSVRGTRRVTSFNDRRL